MAINDRKILLFLISLLLLSTVSFCQNNSNKTYLLSISNKLSPYVFKVVDLTPKSNSTYCDKTFNINICKSDSTTVIQSIKYNIDGVWKDLELDFQEGQPGDFLSGGNLLDVNFDGYKDLVLVSGIGAMGKNWSFDVYLFSVKNKKFHKCKELSGLTNIELDPKGKTITEHIDEGCLSQCYTENTYKVLNNKPVIIESTNQYYDSKKDKLRCMVEKYKDGKVVSKKEVPAGDE
jgi:hypothetical protein